MGELTEQEADERLAASDARVEAEARADGRVQPGDRRVEMAELQEIWRERPVFNGITDMRLQERYGDRVYHVMGVGWFVRPESKET